MHKSSKTYLSLLLLAAIMPLVAACSGHEQSEQQRRADRQKQQAQWQAAFKVAVMPTLDCLPFFVAAEEGLVDTAHADMRLVHFTAQNDCDTALLGGSVECAPGDLVRTEYLRSRGARLDYLIQTPATWQLLASRRARVRRASQLGDKIIATTRHSAADKAALRALQLSKPKQQAYRVQANNVIIRLDMLINNELDAIVAAEPQATQARLHGANVIYSTAQDALRPGVYAFARDAVSADGHAAQLPYVLRAYNAAVDSINKYGPAHYADILSREMKLNAKEIKALPRVRFDHAHQPSARDIIEAGR